MLHAGPRQAVFREGKSVRQCVVLACGQVVVSVMDPLDDSRCLIPWLAEANSLLVSLFGWVAGDICDATIPVNTREPSSLNPLSSVTDSADQTLPSSFSLSHTHIDSLCLSISFSVSRSLSVSISSFEP